MQTGDYHSYTSLKNKKLPSIKQNKFTADNKRWFEKVIFRSYKKIQ